ncbi:rhamnan synthesis F family protein [Bartonella sp. HY761]|uniref:rhamnan synthesis F family protein n=1 Tax=Bartonella sp. HY761 TaxID=2979330 RepID=UPI0021E285F8|nr:rhamnan synthesis F family protein [Bartonella sp. HY761]UXN08010.1 rhamnan synthesis F family protein [Bartonella sp. HY761]
MVLSIKDVLLNIFTVKRRRLPWDFNSSFYQYLYDDVSISGKSPRRHYRSIGRHEGRLYKKSHFVKKTDLNDNFETIVFCCDDEHDSLFFFEAIKKLSENHNIVVVSNSNHLNEIYLPYCNWFILNKIFDRGGKHTSSFIKQLCSTPNLKFVVSNIYEGGFFYKHLEKANIANILIIGENLAFGKCDLSRGLRSATRVVYTSESYAEKVLYDYMYGYPDQVSILSSASQNVVFSSNKSDSKLVIGYGDVSFADGFDLFAKTASLYKEQYPDDDTEFVWLRSSNKANNFSCFEQNQNWLQIQKADNSCRVISKNSAIASYYQKAEIFFDTSRFANKMSQVKSALQTGKAVFALNTTLPLLTLYRQNELDDNYLLDQNDPKQFIKNLHDHLYSTPKASRDQFIEVSRNIGGVIQFVEELAAIGNAAAEQIRQEDKDASELFAKKEFDFEFWSGDSSKLFTRATIKQYIRSWKSGVYPRRPCAGFQPGIYAEYHDLGPMRKDPFLHYLEAGKPNGPWQWEMLTKPVKIEKAVLNQKIALQIHAYYVEKLDVMINALLVNEVRPDLFISVKDEAAKTFAESLLENYPAKVSILIAPNRGRDIGPLLTLFREQLRHGYDIIGHLHTKHSVHIDDRSYAELWGKYLTTNLLGDGKKINAADTIIQTLYNDKNINLVFPDDRNGISWAKNRPEAKRLAPRLGINKLPNYINFPVGTMFWARSDLMQPFFDLELEWNDYMSEPLPLDGTNLHAIERLFGVMNDKISKKVVCVMFGDIKR